MKYHGFQAVEEPRRGLPVEEINRKLWHLAKKEGRKWFDLPLSMAPIICDDERTASHSQFSTENAMQQMLKNERRNEV